MSTTTNSSSTSNTGNINNMEMATCPTIVSNNANLIALQGAKRTVAHTAISLYKKMVETPSAHNRWEQASNKQRNTANARKVILVEFADLTARLSFSKAHTALKNIISSYSAQPALLSAMAQLNPNNKTKTPSSNTIKSWVTLYESQGLVGLLPNHKGSARKNTGWEHIALELYHRPQKPSMNKVARQLREDHGFTDATENNVWYFFSQLPSELSDKSRWRIGSKLYRDSQRSFRLRHTQNLAVGEVYQGDGHTIDVYLRHPLSGGLWRAELTVFQDWKSRYIVGWYLSNAESSITTMAALSHGMGTFNHVPSILYIDNGCGFKSKLMNSTTAGFYANFGIEPIFAIPGNAKAKGNVERFFRVMEEDFSKDFDTYCGKDMSPDVARHFSTNKIHILEKNGIHIPTQEEWVSAFNHWLTKYHNRPHPEYKHETPQSLWNTLERVPVVDMNLLIKPRCEVNVRKGFIRLHSRQYKATHLHQLNGTQVVAEYDMHNDISMRIFDNNGKYLLTVDLVSRQKGLSDDRMNDSREKSRVAAQKRIENKIAENNKRYGGMHIEHEQQLSDLDFIEGTVEGTVESTSTEQALNEQSEPEFDLDELCRDNLANPFEQINTDEEFELLD